MLKGKGFKKIRKNYGVTNFLCRPIWIRYGEGRMWDTIDFRQNSHYHFQDRHCISKKAHYKSKRKTEWI